MAENDIGTERIKPASTGQAEDRAVRSVRPILAEDSRVNQPLLADFLSPGDAHRLRDLLAFAMAVEGQAGGSGRPRGPDAVDGFQRDAEAALEAHAFRTLHNQVEQIRQAAVQEQIARLRPPPGFLTLVLANLIALLLLAAAAVAAWRHYGPAMLAWIGA
ncbi:hypothetical protein G3576_10655 [Roseomonas stagni]|uniref:Uncharacterized protein n=1 Tax=Falsiroseomonas algicola TaxID=2716930 RepID=A0A6M1LJF3_9PROT|nr:hypothetical protein [Falsiroseomonas algicola]NGM20475.1 hypothetical protein [Falsiroseomonas algicola]